MKPGPPWWRRAASGCSRSSAAPRSWPRSRACAPRSRRVSTVGCGRRRSTVAGDGAQGRRDRTTLGRRRGLARASAPGCYTRSRNPRPGGVTSCVPPSQCSPSSRWCSSSSARSTTAVLFDIDFVAGTWTSVSLFWVSVVAAGVVFVTGLAAAFLARSGAVTAQRKLEKELQSTYERLRAAEAHVPRPEPRPEPVPVPEAASAVTAVTVVVAEATVADCGERRRTGRRHGRDRRALGCRDGRERRRRGVRDRGHYRHARPRRGSRRRCRTRSGRRGRGIRLQATTRPRIPPPQATTRPRSPPPQATTRPLRALRPPRSPEPSAPLLPLPRLSVTASRYTRAVKSP